jgi:glycerol-3-phosphate dehydrogenase
MLETAPELNPENLVGGFKFTDCKIEDVERLVIENILAAKEHASHTGVPAAASNYFEAVDFKRDADQHIARVTVRDTESGETTVINPKIVVNSTGIFIDEICKATGNDGRILLRMVSGIHLIAGRFLKTDDRRAAFAFWIDKKILFAVSKGTDRLLVGTTERDIKISDGYHNRTFRADVDEVVRKLKSKFPSFKYDPEKDIHYTRVRPLMFQPSKSDPKAVSRRDLIKWHYNTPNMVSVSGKLGPARHLAELVGVEIVEKLKPNTKYAHTHGTRYPGGAIDCGLDALIARAQSERPDAAPEVIERLVRRYGSRYAQVLALASGPEDLKPIGSAPDAVPMCALVFGFKNEFCVHIKDAMSRTGNTKFFGEGLDCIEEAAKYTGAKLGWDEARIRLEIEDYRKYIGERGQLVG